MPILGEKPTCRPKRAGISRPHIGIDIGSSSIKIVRATWLGGRPRLLAAVSRPLPATIDFASLDAARLHRLLLRELPRHGLGSAVPSTALLPGRCAVTRVVHDRQAIASAAAELGPRSELCSWPLPEEAGYVTYGLPGAMAEAAADALAACGYRCDAVDATPLALWRLIRWQEPADFAVLDWGWESCLLMCSLQGRPGVARDLPGAGLGPLVQRAAGRLGKPPIELLAAIRRRGPVAHQRGAAAGSHRRDGEAITEWLLPEIERVGWRLNQTFAYARRFGPLSSERLYLCGGAAAVPGLASRLQQCLGLPVVAWSWQPRRRRFSRRSEPPVDARFANAIAASLGAALQPMGDAS